MEKGSIKLKGVIMGLGEDTVTRSEVDGMIDDAISNYRGNKLDYDISSYIRNNLTMIVDKSCNTDNNEFIISMYLEGYLLSQNLLTI
jgi:hypothetical protein